MLSSPIVKRYSRLNLRYWRGMGGHHGFLGRNGLPGVRSSVATGFVKIVSAGRSAAALLQRH